MVEVYYYMPLPEVDNAIECGLKLSKWFDKEVAVEGEIRKCISALLNPKDDMDKYKSAGFKCVKLELSPNYCLVGDRYLYEVGQNFPEIMKTYTESIVPVEKYIFGSFRFPECLVTSTLIAGQVSLLDKRLDSPVLIDKSEELYINNVMETYREMHYDFNDVMLYYFYCKLAEAGKVDKIEDNIKKIAVFLDKGTGKAFTVKIPDISGY